MVQDIKRFDSWFSMSYYYVRRKLERYMRLDEDAFHDAYIAIRVKLLFENDTITDFEPYFIGFYKKMVAKGIAKEKKYYHPEDVFFEFLSDTEPISIEDLVALDNLANDILRFVKKKFSDGDYKLFKLKCFETQYTYKELSDYTGISQSKICRKVNHISSIIRETPSFIHRNSKLISTNN